MVLGAVGAGLGRSHPAAERAVESMLEKEGGDLQILGCEVVEDALGIVGPVVIADAGVVPADDEVGAAVVLAHDGVEDSLPGPGVAHGRRKDPQKRPPRRIVQGHELQVAVHTDLGRDVAALGLPYKGMNEQAIHHLQGALLNILVGAMNWISRLEGHDAPPSPLGEGRPAARRRKLVLGEHPGRSRVLDEPNLAGQQHLALLVQPRHAGMGLIGGPVDVLRLPALVVAVDFVDPHQGQRCAAVRQGDLPALGDLSRLLPRHAEGDGQRPHEPIRQPGVIDDALVVGAPHEPGQGAESADGDELEVRDGRGVERHLLEGSGFRSGLVAFPVLKLAVDEASTVGLDGGDRCCSACHFVFRGAPCAYFKRKV